MKLIGFSRKKFDGKNALGAILDVIAPDFGIKDFYFSTSTDEKLEEPMAFDLDKGVTLLESRHCLGFWKKDAISVWIDNQAFWSRYFICPHSIIECEIEDARTGGIGSPMKPQNYLEMAKGLVERSGLDMSIVIGNNENVRDYLRTPLGVGIGLIRVYWIMCFGKSYSRLINPKGQKTTFFSREEFRNGTAMAFMSADSFDSYLALSQQMITMQKMELNDNLFHRLPIEKKKDEGGCIGCLIQQSYCVFLCFSNGAIQMIGVSSKLKLSQIILELDTPTITGSGPMKNA